jgi:hypothetical protein
LCEVENVFDQPVISIVARMQRLGVMRVLLWAALNCVDEVTKKPINGDGII